MDSEGVDGCVVSFRNNNRKKSKQKITKELTKFDEFRNLLCLNNSSSLEKPVDNLQITYLDLSNSFLSDLPDAISDLPLKDLNLSNNKLLEIPQCFYSGLEKIEKLDLSHNEIPKFEFEPNCRKTLRILFLCHNKFKDIPRWILHLRATNLEELYYDFNKVSSLRCIFNNSTDFSVRKLSMRNCFLRKEDCRFLKECRNLIELDISNSMESNLFSNIFEDPDMLFIQPTWKNISILKASRLYISVFPEGITWLETVTEVYLSHNKLMWLPRDGLEFLVNLEILDLSHNTISSIPEKLTWLEHVRVLKFNSNHIEIIPDFSEMKTLETLDLYYNKLLKFDCNIESTNLKYIDLEFNCFDTEECNLEGYKDRRDNFREIIDENEVRCNGFKEFQDYDQYSDSISLESETSISENYYMSSVSEDWDEEIRLSEKKHVDITPSDDEWKGFEDDLIPKLQTKVISGCSSIIYNEDVIFCDAD